MEVNPSVAKIYGRKESGGSPAAYLSIESGEPVFILEDGSLYMSGKPVSGWFRYPAVPDSRIHMMDGVIHLKEGPACIIVRSDGSVSRSWYRSGRMHREDGPAVEIDDREGTPVRRAWYLDGLLHRGSGPAVEDLYEGSRKVFCWYAEGLLHRSGGPAIVVMNGDAIESEEYYHSGQLHRLDGPAIINVRRGVSVWYVDGERHRIDGPAVVSPSGDRFFLQGREVTRQEVSRAFLENRGGNIGRISASDSGETADERLARLKSNVDSWAGLSRKRKIR